MLKNNFKTFVSFFLILTLTLPVYPKGPKNTNPNELKIFSLDFKTNSQIILRAASLDLTNPYNFKFYFDKQKYSLTPKKDIEKIITYFLEFLTIPSEKLWVNLSPYEPERIIDPVLSQLSLGKDLVQADYQLKQLVNSLIHGNSQEAKLFWNKVNTTCLKIAKTTNLTLSLANKIWLVPDKGEIYYYQGSVFIKNSSLKALMQEDYQLLKNSINSPRKPKEKVINIVNKEINNIFKEIFLPVIEKRVNNSLDFANLRQIYYTFILASYYKKILKTNDYYKDYIDKEKTNNFKISLKDWSIKKTYQAYLKNFKNNTGYYQNITNSPNNKLNLRRYCSGGVVLANQAKLDYLAIEDNLTSQAKINQCFLGDKIEVETKINHPITKSLYTSFGWETIGFMALQTLAIIYLIIKSHFKKKTQSANNPDWLSSTYDGRINTIYQSAPNEKNDQPFFSYYCNVLNAYKDSYGFFIHCKEEEKRLIMGIGNYKKGGEIISKILEKLPKQADRKTIKATIGRLIIQAQNADWKKSADFPIIVYIWYNQTTQSFQAVLAKFNLKEGGNTYWIKTITIPNNSSSHLFLITEQLDLIYNKDFLSSTNDPRQAKVPKSILGNYIIFALPKDYGYQISRQFKEGYSSLASKEHENQDYILPLQYKGQSLFLGIFDGVTTSTRGQQASFQAANWLKEKFASLIVTGLESVKTFFKKELINLHEIIKAFKGKTTVTCAYISLEEQKLVIANLGNSRAYLMTYGQHLKLITQDDAWAEQLLKNFDDLPDGLKRKLISNTTHLEDMLEKLLDSRLPLKTRTKMGDKLRELLIEVMKDSRARDQIKTIISLILPRNKKVIIECLEELAAESEVYIEYKKEIPFYIFFVLLLATYSSGITNALGGGNFPQTDFNTHIQEKKLPNKNYCLLLTTDGITDHIPRREIELVLKAYWGAPYLAANCLSLLAQAIMNYDRKKIIRIYRKIIFLLQDRGYKANSPEVILAKTCKLEYKRYLSCLKRLIKNDDASAIVIFSPLEPSQYKLKDIPEEELSGPKAIEKKLIRLSTETPPQKENLENKTNYILDYDAKYHGKTKFIYTLTFEEDSGAYDSLQDSDIFIDSDEGIQVEQESPDSDDQILAASSKQAKKEVDFIDSDPEIASAKSSGNNNEDEPNKPIYDNNLPGQNVVTITDTAQMFAAKTTPEEGEDNNLDNSAPTIDEEEEEALNDLASAWGRADDQEEELDPLMQSSRDLQIIEGPKIELDIKTRELLNQLKGLASLIIPETDNHSVAQNKIDDLFSILFYDLDQTLLNKFSSEEKQIIISARIFFDKNRSSFANLASYYNYTPFIQTLNSSHIKEFLTKVLTQLNNDKANPKNKVGGIDLSFDLTLTNQNFSFNQSNTVSSDNLTLNILSIKAIKNINLKS